MPDSAALPYVTIAGVIVTSAIQYLAVRKTGRDAFERERVQREQQDRIRTEDRREQAQIRLEERQAEEAEKKREQIAKEREHWRDARSEATRKAFAEFDAALLEIGAQKWITLAPFIEETADETRERYRKWVTETLAIRTRRSEALAGVRAEVSLYCNDATVAAFELTYSLYLQSFSVIPVLWQIRVMSDGMLARILDKSGTQRDEAISQMRGALADYKKQAREEIGSAN